MSDWQEFVLLHLVKQCLKMRTIYVKRNFSIILISCGVAILCLYLIDYYNFFKVRNSNMSSVVSGIMLLPTKSEKSHNRSFYKPHHKVSMKLKCSVAIAVILCKAEEYLSYKNVNKTKLQVHVSKDFSRQINQTLVMLKSVAIQTAYRHEKECVTVIILSDTKEHFDKISYEVDQNWGVKFKDTLNLTFVSVTYPKGAEWMKKMFRPCATLRLFIPELVPPEVQTLIYLDTDFIFFNSLQKLMNIYVESQEGDFTRKIAAMAPCLFHYGTKANIIPYYGSSGLNAGLMVMNLTRMRKTMWTNRIRMITTMFQKQIKLADQDILNIYFHFFPEELTFLSCDWNFRPFQCRERSYCQDPELSYGISALHGNALSFTPTGPEPLFYAVFSAFSAIKLNEDFRLKDILDELEAKLLKSEETLHSNCVRYGGLSTLILSRFHELI